MPPNARLEIRGLDGTRDFITVEQIVEAIQVLFTRRAVGVFNVGTGVAVRLLDIAETVREKLGRTDMVVVSTGWTRITLPPTSKN